MRTGRTRPFATFAPLVPSASHPHQADEPDVHTTPFRFQLNRFKRHRRGGSGFERCDFRGQIGLECLQLHLCLPGPLLRHGRRPAIPSSTGRHRARRWWRVPASTSRRPCGPSARQATSCPAIPRTAASAAAPAAARARPRPRHVRSFAVSRCDLRRVALAQRLDRRVPRFARRSAAPAAGSRARFPGPRHELQRRGRLQSQRLRPRDPLFEVRLQPA